jgi:hypothetical protein
VISRWLVFWNSERFAGHIGIQRAARRVPMIEKYPVSRVADAYEQMHNSTVRFRVVLTMGACDSNKQFDSTSNEGA